MKAAFSVDKAPALVLFFFFVPFIVYSVCGLDFYAFGILDFYYRFAQITLAGALGLTAYFLARRHGLRFSAMAVFIALFLVVSLMIHVGLFTVQNRPNYDFEVVKLVIQFVFTFLAIDIIARRLSFETFARATIPVAFILVMIAAIHTAFFAIDFWGRDLYFGMQPNVGGEIVFGAICMIAFSRFPLLRYVAYALALYALMELQARSATVATAFVIAVTEAPRAGKMLPSALLVLAAGAAVMAFLLLVNPNLAQGAIDFVMNEVLRNNDPYRGAGTGFAGREETFELAFSELFARPITGSGLYNSGVTLSGSPIHNGYLRNLAEFGIPGLLLNISIFVGAALAFRKDPRVSGVIIACAFMFLFGARNFGLNIFPFLMWIAILPWAARSAESEAQLNIFPQFARRPRAPQPAGVAARSGMR